MTRKAKSLPVLLLGVCLPLAAGAFVLTNTSADSLKDAKATEIVPLFAKTEPARNPTTLTLQIDDRQVVGWISGTEDFENKVVHVTCGKAEHKVAVQKGNTFNLAYDVKEATPAEFSIGGMKRSVTLMPRPAEDQPSVFFVVDRTAYRPTQVIHFAGFLRKLDSKGEFEPIANKAVEVHLKSEQKQTLAAKLKITSDELGRVTGTYLFSEADALDNYSLTIPGYKGSARVYLGEYRKSKVKLKITGQIVDGKMKVKFEAVDFLEKPVPGSKVSFVAQVVQKTVADKKHALKADDYVYHAPTAPGAFDPENLPEEELLLWEADGRSMPFFSGNSSTLVAQVTGEIDMENKEAGEYTIPIKKEWLKGNCSITIQGVVVDMNGREQRATQSIPLTGATKQGGLHVELGKRYFAVDEKITVKAKAIDDAGKPIEASTTLVAMRLAANPNAGQYADYDDYWYNSRYRYDRLGRALRARPMAGWQTMQPSETVKRTMNTAVAFKGDSATIKLTEAGAYKLVAIATLSDGSTIQNEVGCVVRNHEDLAGLVLQLDRDEITAGEKLTGVLHSRFADARVLLTLRDSSGIRASKVLQMTGSFLKLNEELPGNLRYGCAVDVQYIDQESQVHIANKFIRVAPADQMLTIKTTTKDVYGPGEKVKLDIQVNRNEPVDLVVSVYDQSLLGIAADRSVDIRNFYLADERVRRSMSRDVLRRKIGNVSIEQLIERAKETLAKNKEMAQTTDGQVLQALVNQANQNTNLNAYNVVTLLRLAGVEAQVNALYHNYYGYNWHFLNLKPADHKLTLLEIIERPYSEYRLTYELHNNTLFLAETHPNYANANLALRYFNRNQYMNNMNFQLQNQMYQERGSNRMARGDAHHSVSGNSMHSVEAQGFVSHMPAVGGPALIDADPGQGHIYLRKDFSDSAFWNATVRTDSEGKASVEFKLPDSLTNWQVVVTAISRKMHVGTTKSSFRTFKPIMVWPMIPRVFTEGDKVVLFGSVHNRTETSQTIKVKLKAENGEVLTASEVTVIVAAKSNVPVYWTFKPGTTGFTQLLMTADCAAGSDASLKRLPVTRAGAEQIVTASGFVKDGTKFTVPEGVDLKSASLELTFAPSLAADMTDTLTYLVEYPYGCVEQTMSRFLPAIKVAQVLQQFHIEHPELQKKLPGCVAGGIKRLLELQQPDGGWGWHGNGQTHEMMTPYALYGLLQAEKAGYTIPSETAIQRGLDRLGQFINGMNENQTADRIYCMHVYGHRRDLNADWWQFIERQMKDKRLSDYALALALETAVQKDKKELAARLSAALHNRAQRGMGGVYWQTAGFSRWGDDRFEITAAAMKALVAYDKDDPMIDSVLGFFVSTKRGNKWNSTKDTAMIVYAMCDYLAKMNVDAQGKKTVTFSVNGGDGTKVAFTDGLAKKVTVPGSQLKAGENKLSFLAPGTGVMYRLVFRYWQNGTDVKPMDKGIQVARKFYLLNGKGERKELKSGDRVPRGSYVESEVTAINALHNDMRYVLVENPKPSCGELLPVDDPRYNQQGTPYVLREERTAAVCYHHEQTPNTIQDRCVMLLELAGDYTVSPAHVEMMYQTEVRGHSGNFFLTVVDEKPAK
ncbi:MAG: hypothetical protein K2R98_18720 [Gemmataceae bacterium]|nr:hypothetical protein [Gemmataceae bacterium]